MLVCIGSNHIFCWGESSCLNSQRLMTATNSAEFCHQPFPCLCCLYFCWALVGMLLLSSQNALLKLFQQRRSDFNSGFAAACARGDEHVTNAYVKIIGMNPDRKQTFGADGKQESPLQHAVQNGFVEIVRTLLANGAKVCQRLHCLLATIRRLARVLKFCLVAYAMVAGWYGTFALRGRRLQSCN